jgi:hypothetical protein
VKKVLVFNRGALGEQYGQAAPDGGPLRGQRLEQARRLELIRITNDPPSYWFVLIRNFNQSDNGPDRKALKGLTTPSGNGVWRFLDERRAKAKFEQLANLPIFVTEQARVMETRQKARERTLAAKAADKLTQLSSTPLN